MRIHLKVKGSDAEITALFNEIDADGSQKIDLKELRSALVAMGRAARKHQLDLDTHADSIERQRATLESHVLELESATKCMMRVEAAEAELAAYERKLPLEARLGLALRADGRSAEAIIKAWPGASVGYAVLEAVEAGVRQLDVPGGYTLPELTVWYDGAFREGLQKSVCRPGGGLSLKMVVPRVLKAGKVAGKGSAARREAIEALLPEARRLDAAISATQLEFRRAEEAAAAAAAAAQAAAAATAKAPQDVDPVSSKQRTRGRRRPSEQSSTQLTSPQGGTRKSHGSPRRQGSTPRISSVGAQGTPKESARGSRAKPVAQQKRAAPQGAIALPGAPPQPALV